MATSIRLASGGEMTVGGTLSRAFAAIGARPWVFFGVSFVLAALPYAVISLPLRAMMVRPLTPGVNPFERIWPLLAGGIIVWWVLFLLTQAVLFRVTVAELDGRSGTTGERALAAIRALPALLALSILLSLAVWAASIFLLVPGIILAVIWSVAAPALVAERCGVIASFGRSARLTRGARWRIFGLCVLVFAIYYIAAATVGVGNLAVNGTAGAATSGGPPLFSSILSVALQTGFVAIWTAVQGALYVDLRDWQDGPQGDRLADIFA